MENLLANLTSLAVGVGGKLVLALLIFIIGRMIINRIVGLFERGKMMDKMDPTVKAFMLNFIKIGLNIVLVISIIGVLGVPMASVVAVLASAGLAVGMALQGALSNLAGGIMLLVFRPFNVGDYIVAAGDEGIVKEITLFYTVLTTTDNKKVTIPNGSLMNANVTNCSSEEFRRGDLTFGLGKGNDIEKVRGVMLDVMQKHPLVLDHPDVPFARVSGGTNEAMEFTTRAWCKSADYWTVYFDLCGQITNALGEAGVAGPAVKVING
ncbi:MAG: mechanosensitive ion channel family protein [Lachnospiraceae bacterium]|nr:mechanosensitive ion channel family protein [Lachnospiraceae bacterium]